MKKLTVISIIINVIMCLLLAWNIISQIWYENMIVSAARNMNMDPTIYSEEPRDSLREAWPTVPIEEQGISPERALRMGIAYLDTNLKPSMFERIFRIQYKINESDDGSYYIVSKIKNDSRINWKNLFGPVKIIYQFYDHNVAIDKKNGTILHKWSGE